MTEETRPSRREESRAERLVRRLLAEQASTVDADALLAGARRRIVRRRRVRWAGELLAASIVVGLTVLLVHRGLVDRAPRHQVFVLGNGAEQQAESDAAIQLADGSTLKVKTGTRYRLLTRSAAQPAVEIRAGQAFFDVAQGKGPFIVATPHCTVKAMGTSFLVDAPEYHPNQHQGASGMSVFRSVRGAVVVAVFTGVVQLANPFGSLQLSGGGVAMAQEKSAPAVLEKDMGPGVGLTVYNGNFAVVKERREIELAKGIGETKFTGVAKTIDATSVHFISLSDPAGVQVLDQNYEYDLVSPEKILEKYLDKEVTFVVKGAGSEKATTVKGVLQSFAGNMLTLLVDGSVRLVDRGSIQDMQLGALPQGLTTRPTLVWKTQAGNGGKHLVKVSYMANAINWRADYTAVLNAADTAVDMSGWVTVTNNSGARYENAQLKLIAGDVRRIQPPQERRNLAVESLKSEEKHGGQAFEEKTFAEYHMYTLPRLTTVNDNQVKQIELIEPALGVPVVKFYEYRPNPGYKKVNVKVEFDNKKENKLGIALPKGKVRVYKKDDADSSLEFVGEDNIDHTPKDEKVTLYIGDAFDIVCETKQVKAESGQRWSRQGYEVEIRNHKAEPIEVRVMVSVGANYRVEAETIDGQKAEHKAKDAFNLEYRVKADKDGKAKLAYTIFQSW